MNRVLHYVIGNMNQGGLENNLMQVYRAIDRTRFQFDFVVHSENNYYAKEIEELGGRIYRVPLKSDHFKRALDAFDSILEHEPAYEIVHFHTSYAVVYPEVIIAKRHGCTVIVHAHASAGEGPKKVIINSLFKNQLDKLADIKIAVSELAAHWQFSARTVNGGEYSIVHNSVDTDAFSFNKEVRLTTREQMQLQDKFVVGTTGRLVASKNIDFLIEVLHDVLKDIPNTTALIVGNGPEMGRLMELTERRAKGRVIFVGNTDEVNKYLNAMDVFCFPSLFEGLGISVLEAVCSGLPCFINETLPAELSISETVHRLPLIKEKWVSSIKEVHNNPICRQSGSYAVKNAGYEASENAKRWELVYSGVL